MSRSDPVDGTRWLLLAHTLPSDPAYLRVKVRRRLEKIGAIALKNSMYVLPDSPETFEDFEWLCREIRSDGGSAVLCEARFIGPETDDRLVDDFNTARDRDYRAVVDEVEELQARAHASGGVVPQAALRRVEKRMEHVTAIDFFDASGRMAAREALAAALGHSRAEDDPGAEVTVESGQLWVTRRGVKEDRIASAWLVRRFIDTEATFEFVDPKTYTHRPGHLRFDMFEGEFTHVGDRCTFETLLHRFGLRDPALVAIGEVIHDLDYKDAKFERQEEDGIAAMIRGITRRHSDDHVRIEEGSRILDNLYAHYSSDGR